MKTNSLYRLAGVVALAISVLPAIAQRSKTMPWTGSNGVTETVAKIMSREHGRIDFPREIDIEKEGPDRSHLRQNPNSPPVSQWPPTTDPASRMLGLGGKPPISSGPYTLGNNWTGTTSSESGFVPPDSQGDVGLTQYLVCVNGRIKVFDKNGVLGALNTTTNNFFNSVRSAGANTSDPRVRFDRLSQRWFVVMIDVTTVNNRLLLAVTDGPTISATTVWRFFFMQQNLVAPAGDNNRLADWPTLGIDANALYMGCNMFNPADAQHTGYWYAGTSAWVVRKSSVLGAGPIVATAFRDLTGGAAGVGPEAPMGVDNDDPAATVGYIIGADNASFGTLVIRRITDPGGTPAISGNVLLTVPTTYWPFLVPQSGSPATLDSLDDRLFSAQIRLNRITGQRTLWTAHNVRVSNTGVASSGGDRVATRWYQIANFDATPSLTQSGTIYDPAASNPRHYWMTTVTMSGQGHMAGGFSYSGLADHPSVGYAARFSGDPLGTTQTPAVVIASGFVYGTTAGGRRWGDYSMTSVDPADDMSLWSIQEFAASSGVWGVRVFKLIAPPPAAVSSLAPNSALQGDTLNVTVSGTSSAGSGFYDPGAGFNRLQASFSGTGITVNTVTFDSPTQITLNVTLAANATTGLRNLTITNPDGQIATLNGAFTVTAAPITVNPTSFATSRGVLISGGLPELVSSDDLYTVWRAGPVLAAGERPVDVNVTGASPVATPSSLVFKLEGKATEATLGQTLWLFNYVTDSWEQVDARSATTSDSVTTVTVSSNASRFVNPSTLAMRARFGYKPTGPVLSFPWGIRIDQAVWVITP